MGLLDLIFPKNCLGCKANGAYICAQCLAKMRSPQYKCPHCNNMSFQGKTHPACQKESDLNGIFAGFAFDGVIRKAILALKYRFASDVARKFADLVCRELEINRLEFKNAVLLPIPLHKKRANWRGFNQAEVVGKIIAGNLGWDYKTDLLVRPKSTISQATLTKEERLRNMRGKFAVNDEALRVILSDPGRKSNGESNGSLTFIIFDDVWTTGSTIKEAAGVLKKAGAKELWGLTIAR